MRELFMRSEVNSKTWGSHILRGLGLTHTVDTTVFWKNQDRRRAIKKPPELFGKKHKFRHPYFGNIFI
jgi:hypothetical protein